MSPNPIEPLRNAPALLTQGPVDRLLPGEDLTPSRRAFLQGAGFGVAASLLSGCSRGPLQKVIPYLSAPAEIVSGRHYWLATTCDGCSAACGVLAKCRDGRPIKLEGNPSHALSQGGLCATGQAEVLGLYDAQRIEAPERAGTPIDWSAADEELRGLLATAVAEGRGIRLLTGTLHGPSTRAALQRFLGEYPTAEVVSYDALSCSAILDAHERTHGKRALPSYRFERAEVIVSFDADFLGTWISPVAFAAAYAKGRRPDTPEGWMSTHVQLEARLSLTGAAADRRLRLDPRQYASVLAALCRTLERRAGAGSRLAGWAEDARADEVAATLVDELWNARGRSLVVCGQNSLEAQLLCAYANELLGNYGATLSIARASMQRRGDDAALADLRAELEAGQVGVLVVSGVNPAYDLPAGFGDAIDKAGHVVVHTAQRDETAAKAEILLPLPHGLEAWGDGEPEEGRYSLQQPAIPALRDSRTFRELLHRWCGGERTDLEHLKDAWNEQLHGELAGDEDFAAFFDRALHDGFVQSAKAQAGEPDFDVDALSITSASPGDDGLTLQLYPKVGLLDGRGAHNPWLQELPDPISKVTWDNYACISPRRAEELEVEDGDLLRLTRGDGEASVELPALIQRGQHDAVVAVALGYGRAGTDRFAKVGPEWLEGEPTVAEGETVGTNMAPWIELRDGLLRYEVHGVRIERAGGRRALASTQDHHSLEVPEHLAPPHGEVRDAVRAATFAAYTSDPEHAFEAGHHAPPAELWPDDHAPEGHHWGMAVDLTSCIGCAACSVSCQAENNVPVVGKDEVLRHREMHWMRIDRYIGGEGDELHVDHQPMLCQQCDNAPCEWVCPVLATVHSSEGLNQQVYNRCVGTRYCANTCPYKVRRFNWFDYPREDALANQALNPDVTVRTRGVMEKCSFCAQRIMEAKAEARREGRELADGDVRVACQQSCPTQAIEFGDLADPESRVSRLAARSRSYRVLEELNVKPSVHYLGRVRNRAASASPEGEHHG